MIELAKLRNKPQPLNLKPWSTKHKEIFWYLLERENRNTLLICDGSVRSGKTVAAVYAFVTYILTQFSDISKPQFAIFGTSSNVVMKNIINPILLPMLDGLGIKYNLKIGESIDIYDSENSRFVTVYITGVPNIRAKAKIQGMTLWGSICDEAALYEQECFEMIMSRHSGRDTCGRLGKVIVTCNPMYMGHWLKTDYIDRIGTTPYQYVHFILDDNRLALGDEYIENKKKEYEPGSVFYRRNILGEWCNADGLCYRSFSRERNILHSTVELPKNMMYYVGIDVGDNHPTTFVLLGTDGTKWYVVKEYKRNQATYTQYAQDYINFIRGYHISGTTVDSAAQSFIRELRTFGVPVQGVNKSATTVPEAISIIDGMLNRSTLLVHSDCREIVREFESYSWDNKASETGVDRVIKLNDDILDAMRYGLMSFCFNRQAVYIPNMRLI